jgi:hypothetical protein
MMNDPEMLETLRRDCQALATASSDQAEGRLSALWLTLLRYGEAAHPPAAEMLRAAAPVAASGRARELMEAVAYTLEDWVANPQQDAAFTASLDPTGYGGPSAASETATLQFSDMKPGERYRVLKTFEDFDGNMVEAGTCLTFQDYSYFPYDGGYTVRCTERVIRLAEIRPENHEILRSLAQHFVRLDDDTNAGPPSD